MHCLSSKHAWWGDSLDTIKEKCNRVLNVPAKLSIFDFASFSCSSIEELTQYLTWVLNFSIGLNNVFNIPKFSFCNNYCMKGTRKTLSNQPISILGTILTLFFIISVWRYARAYVHVIGRYASQSWY